jgi:hypothetical protein
LAWVDTQVTGRQRRLDRALALKVGDERRLLHAEWTLRMTDKIPFRVFEYNSLTALALADEAREKHEKPASIESVVVVLTGREEPWPAHGAYRTSSPNEPFSGVQFRIELPAREFEELGAAMAVLADADHRERGMRDVVRSLLPAELVMQNWIFKEGREKGHLDLLAHQFERRLARSLTEDERGRLAGRLRAEGPERLSDLILELSTVELSTWLAPQNGHNA